MKKLIVQGFLTTYISKSNSSRAVLRKTIKPKKNNLGFEAVLANLLKPHRTVTCYM